MEKYEQLKGVFKKDIDKSLANHEMKAAIMQKTLNEEFIKKCTKKCPCCGSMIQKADGCNKMTCGRCRNFFCWLCLSKIDGYEHFREGCTLWEGGKIDENLVDDRMKEATLTVEQLE